jgi:hypothetical protein
MLFAERYSEDPRAFEVRSLSLYTNELKRYFADDVLQVRRPHLDIERFMQWLLPHHDVYVNAHCAIFGRGGAGPTISTLDYIMEGGFLELLATKSRTLGLNSGLLQEQNCHVSRFPLGYPEPRQWVAIGRDNRLAVGGLLFPLIDIAMANFERGVPVS